MGPFCNPQSVPKKMKADSRPSLFLGPIAAHKTAPVLGPISKNIMLM